MSTGELSNIAEIAKVNIKEIITSLETDKQQKKLLQEKENDLGFKIFKVSDSNFKIWKRYKEKNSEGLKDQIRLFENPLVENYNELDVVYECLIKEGFNLNSKIEKIEIKPNTIYKITDDERSLLLTLDGLVSDSTLDIINSEKDTVFICLDSALNDSKKLNLAEKCILKTI